MMFWKRVSQKNVLRWWTFLAGSPERVWRLSCSCCGCNCSMKDSDDRTDVIDLVKGVGVLDHRKRWATVCSQFLTSWMARWSSSFTCRRYGVGWRRRRCNQNFMQQTLGLVPFQFHLSWLDQIDKGRKVRLNVCHIQIARQHRIQHPFRQCWWNGLVRLRRWSIRLAHSRFVFFEMEETTRRQDRPCWLLVQHGVCTVGCLLLLVQQCVTIEIRCSSTRLTDGERSICFQNHSTIGRLTRISTNGLTIL